jgi:hypothetical protein
MAEAIRYPIARGLIAHGLAISAMVLATACARPIVRTKTPEPPTYLNAPQTPLLLLALRLPQVNVTVAGSASEVQTLGEQALANEEARQRAFVAAITERLSGTGVQVLPEIDAGDGPMPPGTALLRIDVTDLPTVVDGRPGVAITCMAFAITMVPFLACAGARNRISQEAHFDVRLYDVSGAETVRIQKGGELVRVVDTSGIRPAHRGAHTVEVLSGTSLMYAGPTGKEAVRFATEQGRRLGELAFEAFGAAVSSSLQRLAAQARMAPPPDVTATSGGEAPPDPPAVEPEEPAPAPMDPNAATAPVPAAPTP